MPLTVAEFTVTAEVPVELSVTVAAEEELTPTLPKLTLDGLTLSVGVFDPDPAPVPLSVTVAVGFVVAVLEIVSAPLVVVALAGANCTARFRLLPAASVTGRLPAPVTANDCPERLIWEIVTGTLPAFCTATARLAVCPT